MRAAPGLDRSAVPALQACAGLAAAMGVGRFVYTPLLPLMEEQAHVSSSATAFVATANYLGYFLGAAALIARPGWSRSRTAFRGSLAVLVASEAVMIAAVSVPLWSAARLVAGVASAFVFVYSANALASRPFPGLGYAGVGVGIAVSGLAVTLLQNVIGWQPLWLVAAALGGAFAVGAWGLAPGAPPGSAEPPGGGDEPVRIERPTPSPRNTWLLAGGYFLEGLGYIILGTFLVAAVSADGQEWTGPASWVLVGAAAAPSTALWAAARRRFRTETLLAAALTLQVVSALLPALVGGTAAAAVAAVLFGGTFMGIAMLAMTAGVEMGVPRAAAVLTAGYAVGQILGPLVVTPLLAGGYDSAFLTAAGVLAVGAVLVAGIRRR
ncbi:YbfB/YjiJ family MFS transporter [Tomitella cavernea]|uniref:YbfB/YjiJ family MFS transporter n=1 Tax=Tomitella cavernea TaxID=1387982 RepID=A0ABP9C7A4_9ACTN|nr:YbfB/YjiJ family MFS transporter [Tomitella cavernea]